MTLFSEFSELLFPSRCIACNTLGPSICSPCRRDWNPHVYRRVLPIDSTHLRVVSSVSYSLVASKVLLAAKENRVKAADNLLIDALAHSVSFFQKHLDTDILVPIPSRLKISRSRGRIFMNEITSQLGERIEVPSLPLLKHARKVRDQSELHLEERWNNLKGAFVVDKVPAKKIRALLVDDLITSGASLTEGARALKMAGIEVIGAVTACSSEPVRYPH